MTSVELAVRMSALAAEGAEPTKAFVTCNREGMTNVKRAAFEEEYAKMVASPLLRKLSVRTAREDAFRTALAEACLLADPPEDEVLELAQCLQNARQNPRAVNPCFTAFEDYLPAEKLKELQDMYDALWPQKVKE
jgi:hypothetical protein